MARGFAGLHGVRYIGVTEMVSALLGMKELEFNAIDYTVLNNSISFLV